MSSSEISTSSDAPGGAPEAADGALRAAPDGFADYEAFWPYYVGEHLDPVCRALHFVGTGLVFAFLGVAIAARDPRWLLACPLAGYAFAWIGHMVFEKNRPATFKYPLWSLRADFRMFFRTLLGRMPAELARARAAREATGSGR